MLIVAGLLFYPLAINASTNAYSHNSMDMHITDFGLSNYQPSLVGEVLQGQFKFSEHEKALKTKSTVLNASVVASPVEMLHLRFPVDLRRPFVERQMAPHMAISRYSDIVEDLLVIYAACGKFKTPVDVVKSVCEAHLIPHYGVGVADLFDYFDKFPAPRKIAFGVNSAVHETLHSRLLEQVRVSEERAHLLDLYKDVINKELPFNLL